MSARRFAAKLRIALLAGMILPTMVLAPPAHAEVVPFWMADCRDLNGFVDAEADRLAGYVAEPFRPRHLVPGNPGLVTLVFHTHACADAGFGGASIGPVQVAQVAVIVSGPEGCPPGGKSCAPTGSDTAHSDVCGDLCAWYFLEWHTNSQELVTWLKAGTGLGEQVRSNDRMTFQVSETEAADEFVVDVPGLFRLEGAAGKPGVEKHFEGEYWHVTDKGVVKIAIFNETLRLTDTAYGGTVTAYSGWLRDILGSPVRPVVTPFSAGVWSCAFYQKQVFSSLQEVTYQPSEPRGC